MVYDTISPCIATFGALGGNPNRNRSALFRTVFNCLYSLSPHMPTEYVITGRTGIFTSFVTTLWAEPPLFLNVEITLHRARVANFETSVTVSDKSKCCRSQTPSYLYLSACPISISPHTKRCSD